MSSPTPVPARSAGAPLRRTALTVTAVALAAVTALGTPVPTHAAPAAPKPPKTVYLTFDDGPHPRWTPRVLTILARHKVRATFFQIGQNAAAHPALVRRVHRAGHSVQNHTWSHPDLRYVSGARFSREVRRTDRAVKAGTGRYPTCLRPPYGGVNRTVRERAAALGKRIRLWTVDPTDWARPGTYAIQRRVLRQVRPGGVILLHDGGGDRSQTVAALPYVLKELKRRGYRIKPLPCR
ncbi:polysaccharide deacetylase family protein [Streptomyces sp. NPDC001941]|uniref:polysaccharide deacetylase family protein n=1 Tax=Streptomyces sp. NPDC001941 TaxID=3154659 RepID=UPI003332DE10